MNTTQTQPQIAPRSHSGIPTATIAVAVTLASETFFFSTVVTAFLFLRGTQPWPVEHSLARLAFPAANTILLLLSALTTALGVRAIQRDDRRGLLAGFGISLALALAFIAGQIVEFTGNNLAPSDAGFGGVFFTLMGFHALHLLAGVFIHVYVISSARKGDFSARRYTPVQVSAWFWYYVSAVWVVLFTVLYLV